MVEEGPKGVKWELGFANFFPLRKSDLAHWDMELENKKNKNGTGILAQNRLRNGIWANLGLEMLFTPLPSRASHRATETLVFPNMKRLDVLPLPHGWDASES